jgi:hypothetical protein
MTEHSATHKAVLDVLSNPHTCPHVTCSRRVREAGYCPVHSVNIAVTEEETQEAVGRLLLGTEILLADAANKE